MINHARTLLANLVSGAAGDPGEEYIPADYVPLTALPNCLRTVLRVLYGAYPDRLMKNYRTRQLLSVVESTELQQHVLALDPRITYDFCNDVRLFPATSFSITVAPIDNVILIGQPTAPDITGITQHQWTLSVEDVNHVKISRFTSPKSEDYCDYTLAADSFSEPLTLPGSGIQVRFAANSVGQLWRIAGLARPTSRLGSLVTTLDQLGYTTFAELFGVTSGKTQSEPFATFYGLWQSHPEFAYRLAGLTLAVIYRLEEVRQKAFVS